MNADPKFYVHKVHQAQNLGWQKRHDRESNPGHLRDRQVYSPLYYRDLMPVKPTKNSIYLCLLSFIKKKSEVSIPGYGPFRNQLDDHFDPEVTVRV